MRSCAWRRLTKVGNSYSVVIPRLMMIQMGLHRGMRLTLVHDDEADAIMITRSKPTPAGISAEGNAPDQFRLL